MRLPSAGLREYYCPIFRARVAILEPIEFHTGEGWLLKVELLEPPLQIPAITRFQLRGRWLEAGAIVVTTDRQVEVYLWRQKEPEEIEADIRRGAMLPDSEFHRLFTQHWLETQ